MIVPGLQTDWYLLLPIFGIFFSSAVATASIISGLASAGAATTGAVLSSRAAGKAAKAQEQGTSEAIDFERERESTRKQEYEREQEEKRRQWDIEQANKAEETRVAMEDRRRKQALEERDIALSEADFRRRAPYRAAGAAAIADLARLAGLNYDTSQYQAPRPGVSGWFPQELPIPGGAAPGANPTPQQVDENGRLVNVQTPDTRERNEALAANDYTLSDEYGGTVPTGRRRIQPLSSLSYL